MNSTFQKIMVIIIAILVFVITFVGSSKEQVVVEANKIVTDSNNIDNNYLVGPKWLSQNLDESNLVILDIRSEKQYNEGHVPGAINAPIGSFIKNNEVNQNGKQSGSWTNLLNKKEISTELQDLGITQKSDVVIYGQSNAIDSQTLGEISWIFKLVGINSRMLNGGYENWIANGLSPVTTEPTVKKSNIEIENFVNMKALEPQNLGKNISNIKLVQLVNDMKVNKDDKNSSVNTQNNVNSNVQNNNQANENNANSVNNQTNTNNQSNSQNNQQANTNNPQGNNNQNNVIQIKLSELLNPNGTLKPVDKLDNLFESKGISPNNIILFYNTNNGNLAFLTLALEMSGFEKIQTYNASLNQILSLEQAITSSEQNASDNNNTNTQNTTGNNNTNSATENNSQANVNNNTQNVSNNSSSNANNTTTSNNSSTNSNNNSNQ